MNRGMNESPMSGITGDWEYAGESSSGPAVIVSASLGEWGVGATALPV